MKYRAFCETNYNGGAIIKMREQTMYCMITADIHQAHSARQTAVEQVYSDALLSGSGDYSREAFTDALKELGASITVTIVDSKITFTLKSTDTHVPRLLSLFKVMLEKPNFASSEIKRIKAQIRNELVEYEENARSIAYDNFVNELYVKTNRRFTDPAKMIAQEILSTKMSDLRELHTTVRGTHWTVTVGGSQTSVDAIIKTIQKCQLSTVTINGAMNDTSCKQKKHISLHDVPSKQNVEFSIGTSLPLTLNHPDYLPFVFGLNVLGKWGGFSGRLMSTVREKEGLTYMIYARTETVNDTEVGHWRIVTFFAPEKAIQGLQSTLREIVAIHSKGITKSEFERFRVILNTQQSLLADSLTQSVHDLHSYFCAGFALSEIEQFKQRLSDVTKKQVDQALKKYLCPRQLVISGAGPIRDVKSSIFKLSL